MGKAVGDKACPCVTKGKGCTHQGAQKEATVWAPGKGRGPGAERSLGQRSFSGSGWRACPPQATTQWAAGPVSDLSRLDRHGPTSLQPSGGRWHPHMLSHLQEAAVLFTSCSVCICWAVRLLRSLEGRSRPDTHTPAPLSLLFVINKFILHLLNQD